MWLKKVIYNMFSSFSGFTILLLAIYSIGHCQQEDFVSDKVSLKNNYSFVIVKNIYQNTAIYTKPEPVRDKYNLIASTNDNIWNWDNREMNFVVHKPFYKSWVFKIFAVLGSILFILAIIRYRIRQIRLMNLKLTELVKERTRELEQQNNEIIEQRDLATSQRDQIKIQNEELEYHRNNLADIVKEQTYELSEAKEKAEESDKLKTAFLENISHEIRTPLNVILGFINLLIEKKDDQESRDYYLRIINESGKGMLGLVEDIIDFSRIQIGDLKPVYKECNITELIKGLVSINREKIAREKPKLNILAELPDEEVIGITDKRKLNQILAKLIENSIKFTNDGYIRIGIHKYNSSNITFIVEDTGIGIDPEHTDKIFDRFFMVLDENPKKLYRGSGLGLAFAKVITELMGGKIWVESQLKKGSKFYFSIPHIPLKHKEESEKKDAVKQSYKWPDKKVLIAEDHDSNYLLIEAYFKDTGVSLYRAKDGVELLEVFVNEPDLDLIFLDLKMPRMNGINALNIIRESNKSIPVFAQTAYDRTYHREECLKNGCNEYFVKPLRKKEMLEMVRKYFG